MSFKSQFIIIMPLIILLNVYRTSSAVLDYLDCGVDESLSVAEGDVKITEYPWLGILYYQYRDYDAETRAVTTVALIHKEFLIGAAADIGPMPKHDFRRKSRVLLGQEWGEPGRRVRNYVLHPEYGETTYNTLALIQLRDSVKNPQLFSLCPPPKSALLDPVFYVVKMKEDFYELQKEVIKVLHIPGYMCKDFYVAAKLYSVMMRPSHVACAVSLESKGVCVWNAGSVLVVRDVWGRWQLLGVGVRGPGCGAPSRFFDIMSYLPWIENSLGKFQRVTITKINDQRYVVRSGEMFATQRFGNCDTEEVRQILYREMIRVETDNNQRQAFTYNMTLLDQVEFTCLTLSIINGSASSLMSIKHYCGRDVAGKPCYFYRYSSFDISVEVQFSDTCWFEMVAYGWHKNLSLIDMQAWRWQEGAHYQDFSLERSEYRGQTLMTEYGFEPVDYGLWVPEYDLWTTTLFDNGTDDTTISTSGTRTRSKATTTVYTGPSTKRSPRYRTYSPTRPITTTTTCPYYGCWNIG